MTINTDWPLAATCGRTEPAAEGDRIWCSCRSSPSPGCEVWRKVCPHWGSSRKHCSRGRIRTGKDISPPPSPGEEQSSTTSKTRRQCRKGNNGVKYSSVEFIGQCCSSLVLHPTLSNDPTQIKAENLQKYTLKDSSKQCEHAVSSTVLQNTQNTNKQM